MVSPASHHQGALEHAGEGLGKQMVGMGDDAAWATANYRCGDVVMFNSLTVHRAGDNLTNRLRISADYRYQPAGA
jgi:hypothetical protein